MQTEFTGLMPRSPIQVAYGMGVDSTALLVGLVRRGLRPDKILFADTGGEKRETYDYELEIQNFLSYEGFPPVETVTKVIRDYKNWPPYYTLEENCLTNGTLPGISFGPATCSVKWKQDPQHTHIKEWPLAQTAWAYGQKVVKLIGFDASPQDRRRTFRADERDSKRYQFEYPLIGWGWDRQECIRQIKAAGLKVPPKSSCFFCCAMKPWEVESLTPDMLRRIVRLEARAHPRLRTTEGLWRTTVKGTRGGTPRPGSMTTFIREKKLLHIDEIDAIWSTTITEIVAFQEGYAAAKAAGLAQEYLDSTPSPII